MAVNEEQRKEHGKVVQQVKEHPMRLVWLRQRFGPCHLKFHKYRGSVHATLWVVSRGTMASWRRPALGVREYRSVCAMDGHSVTTNSRLDPRTHRALAILCALDHMKGWHHEARVIGAEVVQ
jgi:hypothetical protein